MSDSDRPTDGVEQSSSELRCEADYDDWVDIAESEFVDYVEGYEDFARCVVDELRWDQRDEE